MIHSQDKSCSPYNAKWYMKSCRWTAKGKSATRERERENLGTVILSDVTFATPISKPSKQDTRPADPLTKDNWPCQFKHHLMPLFSLPNTKHKASATQTAYCFHLQIRGSHHKQHVHKHHLIHCPPSTLLVFQSVRADKRGFGTKRVSSITQNVIWLS